MTWIGLICGLILSIVLYRRAARIDRLKETQLISSIRKCKYVFSPMALGGGPPVLKCTYCDNLTHELFYGACKECAKEKLIPLEVPGPEWINEKMGR